MNHNNERCYALFTFNGHHMCTDFPKDQKDKAHEHLCGLDILSEVQVRGVVLDRNAAEEWVYGCNSETKNELLFIKII